MANFFSASSDEQIDLLSVWWDKYKYILGLLLAASVIFIIYRDYSISSSDAKQLESAKLYDDFLISSTEDKRARAEEIINLYSDTLYADFAALHLAKILWTPTASNTLRIGPPAITPVPSDAGCKYTLAAPTHDVIG